jgi:hypothetical protein
MWSLLVKVYGVSQSKAFGWTSHAQAPSSLVKYHAAKPSISKAEQQILLSCRLNGVSSQDMRAAIRLAFCLEIAVHYSC